MIYLDHAATTPLDPAVGSAMEEARARVAGNPSSVHGAGRRSRAVLNAARERIAGLLGAAPSEIVFTGSGSEANNLVIKGFVLRHLGRRVHLVVSAIEHDSVWLAARYCAERFDNVRLSEIEAGASGRVDPSLLDSAWPGEADAALVSLMTVNNETGVRQPVEEVARIARSRGALFHTDAIQAAGREKLDVRALPCDFLTIAAHKIHGPAGAALAFVRRGARIDPLVHGGHQEHALRAGTENLAAVAGLAKSLEIALDRMESNRNHAAELEEGFLSRLSERGVEFVLNGGESARTPGLLNLSIRGVRSHDLVAGMDVAGFAVSAGAACSSGVIEASRVLQAMKLERWRVDSGVRISFGRTNTLSEATDAADALAGLASRLRDAAFAEAAG